MTIIRAIVMSPFDHNHFSSPCSSSCHLWVAFNHNYLFIIIYTLTQNHHLPARHCCFWRTVGVFKDLSDRLDVWGECDVFPHVSASVFDHYRAKKDHNCLKVNVVPHVWGSAVGLAAGLHAVATLPLSPYTAK